MLQLDAFCEHTMQQNGTAAGAPLRSPLREFTALPDPLTDFKEAPSRREGGGEEREEEEREGEGRRGTWMEGGEGEGRLTLMRSWNRSADWLRPAL